MSEANQTPGAGASGPTSVGGPSGGLLLAGKVALVTGAGNGIGRAIAQRLALDGADVALVDIDAAAVNTLAAELASLGRHVLTGVVDVTDERATAEFFDAVIASRGRLDVAVANAGIFSNATVEEATVEDWERVMSVDGRGCFLTCKHAIRVMLPRRAGSVVCISSISGVAGQPRQAVYGPAKFVVTGLTKHLAVEWAKHGIRVNAVAPGTIDTPGLANLPAEVVEELRRAHPMQRLGTCAEVADAVAFLASDRASFITGVVLPVDGGYLAR